MIAAMLALGGLAFANACYQRWKKWPEPDDWQSDFGEIPPR